MTSAVFRFEPLGGQHNRKAFRCGEAALDRYLQTQATQVIRRKIADCFVAVEIATGRLAAYYTLSAASVPLVDLPTEHIQHLPRYPTLPAVRIGRLGRTMRTDAALAILVDARNDHAAAFYQGQGFRALVSRPRALYLPVATMQSAFDRKRGPKA